MLYIGYLIILYGQNIKKSVSESSIELPRLENCISRSCHRPLWTPPKTPKLGEKHIKRG